MDICNGRYWYMFSLFTTGALLCYCKSWSVMLILFCVVCVNYMFFIYITCFLLWCYHWYSRWYIFILFIMCICLVHYRYICSLFISFYCRDILFIELSSSLLFIMSVSAISYFLGAKLSVVIAWIYFGFNFSLEFNDYLYCPYQLYILSLQLTFIIV